MVCFEGDPRKPKQGSGEVRQCREGSRWRIIIKQVKNVGSWSLILLAYTCLRVSIVEVSEEGCYLLLIIAWGRGREIINSPALWPD